jgi:hypothetical protein
MQNNPQNEQPSAPEAVIFDWLPMTTVMAVSVTTTMSAMCVTDLWHRDRVIYGGCLPHALP